MKKDLKVLYITESKSDMQELVRILQEEDFSTALSCANINEIISTSLNINEYDLIVLGITGSQCQTNEFNSILDILGTEQPIIALINEKNDRIFLAALDCPCFDYLYKKDILFMGQLVKHLVRESRLLKKLHAAEGGYKKERERLNTTLASIGDGVITTDLEGHVEFMNQTAEELTGWEYQDAKGSHIDEVFRIINKETNELLESPFSRAMRKGSKSGLVRSTVLISKDGNEYYISASSSPIKDNDMKTIGLITVFRDVTRLRKIENDLEIGQRNLQAIFDAAPTSMLIIDERISVKNANRSFLHTFDKSGTEIIDESIGAVFGCLDGLETGNSCGYASACQDCRLRNALEGVISLSKPIKNIEIRKKILFNNQETERYFRINAVPLFLNNVKYAIVIIDDITEYRKLEEGLRKYRLLSENANDIILFADISGVVIEANDAAVRAFGYEREELFSKSIFTLVNPDPKSPVGAQPFQANAMGIYYEATAYRKDGGTFTAEVSMQGTEISSSKVLMAILRDMTEKKRINEELKQAKESAETANQAKSEFLANMSHEIRTPLNGMIGMVDLALMTNLTPEQKEDLYTAKECAVTLLNLINDILDFSKIEARKLTIENLDYDIRDFLEQTTKPHVIKSQGKGLRFQCEIDEEIPQVVNGDPHRLKQIINNLVGNAVKFTESGEVDLSARLISKNDEYVELEFSVSDTGIGMTSEDMERLFYSFSQVDGSITRKYGGTGLGLAISKQLVEMMGGLIRVKSNKGSGSTFYFTIRLRNGNIPANEPESTAPVGKVRHPLRILLVEDDKINQLVIVRMMQETGHRITTADSGIEALRILSVENFDVILMDIQMPELDGIETTRRIRKGEELTGGHIPIIAHTAYALQDDRERFLSAGMDGYISKPIQINSFLDTVETIIERLSGNGAAKTAFGGKDDNNMSGCRTDGIPTECTNNTEPLLKRMDKNISLLKHSFEQKDLSGIEKYAHVIKKLSSEITAPKLRSAAFKVELAVRRGNISESAEYFDLVKEELLKYKNESRLIYK